MAQKPYAKGNLLSEGFTLRFCSSRFVLEKLPSRSSLSAIARLHVCWLSSTDSVSYPKPYRSSTLEGSASQRIKCMIDSLIDANKVPSFASVKTFCCSISDDVLGQILLGSRIDMLLPGRVIPTGELNQHSGNSLMSRYSLAFSYTNKVMAVLGSTLNKAGPIPR
jgi:hypothetical protein